MASITKRGNKYYVIYNYKDDDGKRKQKWESWNTMIEAKKRKREVEYKKDIGDFFVPKCTTVRELINEYIELYGKQKWALSTYERNTRLASNYILPILGNKKLTEINAHSLEVYYRKLQETKAVENPYWRRRSDDDYVRPSVIRDIHKFLKSCFRQAVKWELMNRNPAEHATVPRYESREREIWTAETLMYALSVCKDDNLALAMHLAFSCSLRIGEILGLTWDCVDLAEESVANDSACLYVEKVVQRVSREALKELSEKDVIFVFPNESSLCKTVRILKKPKTRKSIRRVFMPPSVAAMLVKRKKEQEELRELLGNEYQNFNLVFATSFGLPVESSCIRKSMLELIEEYKLPKVCFHSLRHTSITYKLKLNGGDIKSVQGDSGHSQVNMVTEVYSHILDEDRKRNAELFEEAFYRKKDADPIPGNSSSLSASDSNQIVKVPEGVDPELLQKVLRNPEMAALLTALAKSFQ